MIFVYTKEEKQIYRVENKIENFQFSN